MTEAGILREVNLTFQLAPEMELEACEKSRAIAASIGMSSDRIDEVGMAVVEACINAIEHSRATDRRLYVHIAVVGSGKPEQLKITVRDFGVGFDPTKLVEPRIEEKLSANNKRGWGLKIIEGLMDGVDVRSNDAGTEVIMSKKVR